jgi:predicted nucleic acid-binding protein
MTQMFTSKHLTSEAIALLVDHLPDYVRSALEERSIELECPIEGVIEMAIASFLDEEALSFEDCLLAQRLGRGID